ncbi:MAG: amidohydrolase family protein [Desulfuromonadales bacterium]|nr:amidohydrolase family protein [Desulfuromonadales bacterium]
MKNPMGKPILYRARFLLPISAPPLENGALLVDGGQIIAVDTFNNLAAAHPGAAVIDFGDTALLPPMVNAHTHLELSAFADWAAKAAEPAAPQDFVDWILWLVRVRRSISAEQLYESLAAGLRSSLLAGTGAVGDIFTGLGSVSAYQHSPLHGRVFAEVLGHEPAVVAGRLAAIAKLLEHHPGPSLDWGLSPHAPYTLSSAATDQVFAFAERQSLQCSIHLAESADETAFLQNGSGAIAEKLYTMAKWNFAVDSVPGCGPVTAFCKKGRLRHGDLAVHGVQVDPAEIDLLKQTGCIVVLCPRSNAALNVGKAPVAAYLKAGVPLALGTDSLASSSSLSIWDEMAFAGHWFPGEAGPREWLEIATLGGARALGLHKRMGQLTPGCDASFQVVALPEMPGINQLEEILCAGGADVRVTHLYLASRNVLPGI